MVGFSSTIAFVVLAVIVVMTPHLRIKAASFSWLQTDWVGGADTAIKAGHQTNQSGWTKYYSAGSVDVSSGELKLQRYSN